MSVARQMNTPQLCTAVARCVTLRVSHPVTDVPTRVALAAEFKKGFKVC